MKLAQVFVFIVMGFIVFILSCQKGISWYIPSEGSLEKDVNGNCAPVTINGNYIINQNTTDSNNLVVTVNVTAPGSYTIYTDTLNGYSFSANGKFEATGIVQVKLSATGEPGTAETDYFSVYYNNSICQAAVTVKASADEPAIYSFLDDNGNCMNDTINGSYAKDILLDTSCYAIIGVNVTATGTYSIVTNTMNGYMFSGSGTFTNTGLQTVKLTATGTPIAIQTDKFSLTTATSSCSFTVTVLPVVVPTNNDYFPLTDKSYWVYDDLANVGDSIKRTIDAEVAENGNTYIVMKEEKKYFPTQYLFRKSADMYYEFARIDNYTGSFEFAKEIDTTLLFLKQRLKTGENWETVEVKDTASFGQLLYLKYNYTCTQTNATVTLNGKVFTNVYKITMLPLLRSEFEDYGHTGETYIMYYAKGIGLIYMSFTYLGYTSSAMQLRDWHVY